MQASSSGSPLCGEVGGLALVVFRTISIISLVNLAYSTTGQERRLFHSPSDSHQVQVWRQSVCPNYMNSVFLSSRTLPLLLAPVSDVCWSLSTDIPYIINSWESDLVAKQQTRTQSTGPQSIPVDVLFVTEVSSVFDVKKKKQKYLEHLVDTLIHLSNNVDTRFGAIAYSVEDSREARSRTTKFRHITTADGRGLFLSSLNMKKNGSYSNSPELFRYVSLSSNLDQIHQFLLNNSLRPRTHSDLYIISFLDRLETTSGSQLSDSERTSINMLKENIEQLVTNIITTLALPQHSPLSLQFVFDSRNHVAVRFLGDPLSSSNYDNCDHFNKAMTLKALLGDSSRQADTLQAHLLSQGIQTRTMTWKDLRRDECVYSMVHTLSGLFPLYPTFRNNCDSASECSDCFCSPLHGWVKRKASDQVFNSQLFQGRSPISPTFSAAHEDLALTHSNESSSKELPEEKLTIYAKPSTKSTTTKIIGGPKMLRWSPIHLIAGEVIGRKEPLLLHNTVVHTWPAMQKWNFTYLYENLGLNELESVKCTDTFLTFDPDRRTSLKLNISIPFVTRNMTREEFFSCVSSETNNSQCSDNFIGHYYFGSVPVSIKEDLMPDWFLYHTEKDYKSNRQFIWISSAGMITHTHFDQDYNLFVQLVGRKRFTLWSTFQHELMYTYPRVHPMWHKSQVNYKFVDTLKFPAYGKAKATQVEVGPGDVLYVPPYIWHYVETLSPSVSLSTWSHDYNVYNHMNAIYRHDHKFDLIESPRGQMFVLRLYLDMMIHHLYGVNETTAFFVKLVQSRFSPLTHLFPPHEDDPLICRAALPNMIPICVHVHGYAKLDMLVIGGHFEALEPEVRDILFMDYVEEITAQVVGVKKMLAFFRYCFLGQEYYITEVGDDEHALWDYKDVQEEDT